MARAQLTVTGGLEADTVRAVLATHATAGSEEVSLDGTCRRLLDLAGGPQVVTVHLGRTEVVVEAPAAVLEEATERVRWWLDLDTDPSEVVAHLQVDPRLVPLLTRRPALRPVRHPAGYEAAIDTVLGQQVSLSAARLFGQRLRLAYSPGQVGGLRVFPDAETLLEAPTEELRAAVGLTTSRARTVQALAALFADGFSLAPGMDPAAARQALLAVPGIGPWTVEYLALRVLGDPDAFPASDAVVRRALGGATSREAGAAAQAWRPFRAWATAHLWAGQSTG